MGVFHSASLDDAEASVLSVFEDKFLACWQFTLVNAVKARHGHAVVMQTQAPPPPAEMLQGPLKEGRLLKLGAHYRAWRERRFVATGAEGDFAVRYFDGDELRGEMAIGGYAVVPFTAAEAAQHGSPGVRLVSAGRRTWMLRLPEDADAEDGLGEWLDVFGLASRRAAPLSSCDAVTREAFLLTLRATRQAHGLPVMHWQVGEEVAALCELIVDAAGGGAGRSVPAAVRERAGAAWARCRQSTAPLEGALRDAVEALLPDIVAAQAGVREAAADALRAPLAPALRELRSPLKQVFGVMMGPLRAAARQLVLARHALPPPPDVDPAALVRYTGPLRRVFAALEPLDQLFAGAATLLADAGADHAAKTVHAWLADPESAASVTRGLCDCCIELALDRAAAVAPALEARSVRVLDDVASELLPGDLLVVALEIVQPRLRVPPRVARYVDVPETVRQVTRDLLLENAATFTAASWGELAEDVAALEEDPEARVEPGGLGTRAHWAPITRPTRRPVKVDPASARRLVSLVSV